MTSWHRRLGNVVALVVVIGSLLVSSGCSSVDDGPTATAEPSPSEVDVGFSRDMAAHHAQAVDMADRMRARTADPRLRSLATDIVLTQQSQIGRMQGWLELWGESFTSTDPPMGWMAHSEDMDHGSAGSDDAATMPGMAAASDLAELDTLDLAEAERRFLEMMIEHHRGGVQMAEAAVEMDPSEVVARLARTIVEGQTAEIDLLEELLAERTSQGPP